jgi:hypothetical protein
MSLLGTGQAGATARAGAPTQRFAVGVRQYAWSRGSRRWTSNYFGDSRTVNTFVDWMRWSLYGDTAPRDRLRADATSSTTTWESALS